MIRTYLTNLQEQNKVKHAENEKNVDINNWKYQFGAGFWTIPYSKKFPILFLGSHWTSSTLFYYKYK